MGKAVLQGAPALILSRFSSDELPVITYLWCQARPFCRFLVAAEVCRLLRVKNRYKLNARNSDRQQ